MGQSDNAAVVTKVKTVFWFFFSEGGETDFGSKFFGGEDKPSQWERHQGRWLAERQPERRGVTSAQLEFFF